MKRPWIWVAIVLVIACGFYLRKKLTVYRELLGEVSFYNDGTVELKVVKIFENLPLHYVGPHWSVACKSPKTAHFSEWKYDLIDAGWNRAPYSNYLIEMSNSDGSVEAVAEKAKKAYYFQNNVLIVLSGTGVYFSLDQCNSFVGWDVLRNLPKEIVVGSTPEFEKCERDREDAAKKNFPPAYGDCAYFKFAGSNQPSFDEIVSENGKISFRMSARALEEAVKIESLDSGKTWQVQN